MRKLGTVCLVWLMVFLPAAAGGECKLALNASLGVTPDKNGGPMVPMVLDGHQVSMLVDTGSIFSMLTKRKVDEFGLTELAVTGIKFSSGQTKFDHFVKVKSVSFGDMSGQNAQFLVMPDSFGAPDADGTLGPDFLSQFDVEFDFAQAKINLFEPYHCEQLPIYWLKSGNYTVLPIHKDQWGHIILDIVIDGKTVSAELDTGTTDTFMSLDLAKSVFGIKDEDAGLEIAAHGNRMEYLYPFKLMSFGGISVGKPRVWLNPSWHGRQMILGLNVLRQLHLYVSYKDQKIYATAVTAH